MKRIQIGKVAYEWKGNLDVELTIDVLKNIPQFDTLVLMSGDSDFAALLDTVKEARKRVIVMVSTKGHVSRELLERAKYVNLKKLRDEITYREKQSPRLPEERFDQISIYSRARSASEAPARCPPLSPTVVLATCPDGTQRHDHRSHRNLRR